MTTNVLIWCHGGCFGGGSPQYDKKLRAYLAKHDWVVATVEFSLTSWEQAVNDVLGEVAHQCIQHPEATMVLGGVSSGGFIAHHVANQLRLPAALICPVIKPATRHLKLAPSLQNKQLKFFQSVEKMQQVEDSITTPNAPRFVLYGTKDFRAPMQAYANWMEKRRVFFCGWNGGHEICADPPCGIFLQGLKSLL